MENSATVWIDRISLLLLVGLFIYTGLQYGNLPDTIPIHYNGKGVADGFGPKKIIWLLPIIGIFVYFINSFFYRYFSNTSLETQRKWGSGFKGKSDEFIRNSNTYNALQMTYLNLILVVLFCYITYDTIRCAQLENPALNPWIMWMLIACIFIPVSKMVIFSLRSED